MKKALVPGSFDPITVGHMNIIERACRMYDVVYVTVFINAAKTPRFDTSSRLEMVKAACAHLDNVICDSDDGMLADYCGDKGITAVVKGVRNSRDFEYEVEMAHYNRERNPGLDTVLLAADPGLEDISSTALCSLIKSGGDFGKYIPGPALPILEELIEKRKANI